MEYYDLHHEIIFRHCLYYVVKTNLLPKSMERSSLIHRQYKAL